MRYNPQDLGLPKKVRLRGQQYDPADRFMIEEVINNYLSDTYGWLVESYSYLLYKNHKDILVYDIVWDTSDD